MFNKLIKITDRPKPFEFYTAPELWNDSYISKQMLDFHLNSDMEAASRNHKFIERSCDWIKQKFNINQNSSVCDFGCGPGLYTTRFAKFGADVTGIDFSERSINHANLAADKEYLKIKYVNQNYLEFESATKYDLITMIFCDFSVLSTTQINILLKTFKKHLKDDGKILLDVFSTRWFDKQQEDLTLEVSENQGFWSENKHFVFKNTIKYNEENLYLDKYHIFEKEEERVIYNWLQCYTLDTLTSIFEENGLTIHQNFSNVAGDNIDDSDEITIIVKHKL